MAVLDHDPTLSGQRHNVTIIAEKGYVSAELDRFLAEGGVTLLRPFYRNGARARASSCSNRSGN